MYKEAQTELKKYLERKRALVDRELDKYLPSIRKKPTMLHKAMRYSVFAGGKRLRPILAITSFEMVGGKSKIILPVACALELIHTYSLIHDDLPCMDNDDLRRGKPTSHKVFGSGMAILAGDALHALAFQILAKCKNPLVFEEVAKSIGTLGMVGGQAADLEAEGEKINSNQIHYIHTHKTGELIKASIRAGAVLGKADKKRLQALTSYGKKFGLAFQIIDDILDIEGETKKLGKKVGSDNANQKATFPKVVGLEKSKKIARNLLEEAKAELNIFNNKSFIFNELTEYIFRRRG
jgi:geranylgeranyl diphosphate synthase type II